MTETHSKLPPSSAARRMACPGSRALEERYGRKEESEASREGTKAHEVAARYLRESDIVGLFQPEGYTEEMYEGARIYEKAVRRFCNLEDLHIEERVDISNVHPDMWGTPDAWCVQGPNVHVFDYKFGYTPVEAFENWQLIAYACGIVKDHPNMGQIYIHIIQPRDYISTSPHKVWNMSLRELEDYRQRLQVSSALSMSSSPELKVSEQCKYCTARHACPALRKASFGSAELAYRDIPQGLDAKAVGNELKLLHEAQDLLAFRVTALETEVQHLLQSGQNVDHYELASSTGRMNWNVDKELVVNMGIIHGVDVSKMDIMTPTQAIKAGVPESVVLKCSERKQSLKLSRIDLKKSAAIFKQ